MTLFSSCALAITPLLHTTPILMRHNAYAMNSGYIIYRRLAKSYFIGPFFYSHVAHAGFSRVSMIFYVICCRANAELVKYFGGGIAYSQHGARRQAPLRINVSQAQPAIEKAR